MPPIMDSSIYLAKAEQCLAGAALAVAHGQYNNAANRAYYAAYQAAVAALNAVRAQAPAPRYWAHDFVLREYSLRLACDRGDYAPGSRSVLKALHDERLKADYEVELISRASGEHALALTREFVGAVRQRLGEQPACPARAGSPAPEGPASLRYPVGYVYAVERPSPRATGALEPLMSALRTRFPEARFAYRESPDRLRCYLDIATDCEDDVVVLEAVAGAAVDLLLQQDLQVHACPFRRLPPAA